MDSSRLRSIIRPLIIAVFFCVPSADVLAGGSFLVEKELMPILEQQPDIKEYLFRTLDIAPGGFANRIGNNVNPKFGGRRIGPYIVRAKPKGKTGPYTIEIIVHTHHVFLDADGGETDVAGAREIRENFLYIEYRPLDE